MRSHAPAGAFYLGTAADRGLEEAAASSPTILGDRSRRQGQQHQSNQQILAHLQHPNLSLKSALYL